MNTTPAPKLCDEMHRVQYLRPLRVVIGWELRRLHAARWNWVLPLILWFVCATLIWFKHSWGRPVVDGRGGATVVIIGTSMVGLPYLMIFSVLIIFGIVLPFATAGAIAHDYEQRIHEVVMSTSISTPVYVWGRYTASLLIGVGLALVALSSVLVMAPILAMVEPGYPSPNVGVILAIWAIAVLPATILVTSLSFLLGTLWPRRVTIMKLVTVVAWVVLAFTPDVFDHGGTWFTYWNPTSYGIVRVQVDHFLQAYQAHIQSTPGATAHIDLALQLQQQPLALAPWILSHSSIVGISFLLIVVISQRFDRFRRVLH